MCDIDNGCDIDGKGIYNLASITRETRKKIQQETKVQLKLIFICLKYRKVVLP